MHSIEIDSFLSQPKTIFSKPSSIQARQSSNFRSDTSIKFDNFLGDNDILFAPKQEKITEHLLRVHHVTQPFAFKKKETVFYNTTHQPAVTHILKTLLEHDFHDVKI